jgi:hypothetical protein
LWVFEKGVLKRIFVLQREEEARDKRREKTA